MAIWQKKHLQLQVLFCVDYTGKISNFFEDLERLDRFAESVEDELHNLIIEKAES